MEPLRINKIRKLHCFMLPKDAISFDKCFTKSLH